ncbi:diguanylate cyclase/phosphodiesterase (GGDEF & EAL domains) with PAS/PAC sensor(s) [hydrothermal vent metagenome]|uniref:Diguanylate cyclase/phosphodiesterase (GGDEF & EAL domains) with PAS/PAC sensor(S) n=1 Tax=hydrothermal vent metagenome TaxID=652676 RepID=A0A3B0XDR7_9ZZZZ
MLKKIKLPQNRELLNLFISGLAITTGLVWMFLGNQIIALLVTEHNQDIFYYFFSGVIFSLAFIGFYGFIRTVLYFAEFMIEEENLNALIYKNLLTEEDEGVFLKTRRGVYKTMTPVARQILNLEDKQVIGFSDKELYKFSTANKILHEDKRVLEYGDTIEWETPGSGIRKKNDYLCKKVPCRDNSGSIIGILGICKNISTLKATQRLNQQLEDRYSNLFNKLPYPVLILDPASFHPYSFNNAMSALLDYEKAEFSRMRISHHIDPCELTNFQQSIANILDTHSGEFETRLVTRQRDIVNITGYAQKIIIDDKQLLHMFLYDNTDTRRSTDILIGSELKYRSLFEHANDAIIVVSPNSLNIIDANEIAILLLGYNRDDLLLMSIIDLDTCADHTLTQAKIIDLETYNHALYEHQIQNKKGEKQVVEINAHKLNYGKEDVYQFVIRNIGTRKKTEAALRASENRYRQMFQSNMAIKLVIDPDRFCIEDANMAACEFYGYSIDELKNMNLSQINILSRDKLNILIEQTREQNLGFYSCPHRLSDGEIRFVEVRDGPMEIEGRQLIYSIIYDVTASKEAENQALVASKMFDYSTDAVMLINDKNQVVSVNHAFSSITGYQQSEIQNSAPEIILSSPDNLLLNESVYASIDTSGQWAGEIWHRLKNGQSRPLSVSINCIHNENTKTSSYVVMLSPKYGHKSEHENSIHFVELTQLPNRSLFIDRLKNALDRAQRNKARLGVILIDFKKFSLINANYGYDLGDQLLQAISKRLSYNTRDSDTVSHLNSDDFAVLIEDLDSIQQVGIVAQKLLSTLSETYQTAEHSIDLTVSMGISIYPDDSKHSDELITCAQAALTTAQKSSVSHFELTSAEMNRTANMWLQSEAELHIALRDNQFFIVYLPQVNLQNNTLTSLEALVRWQHPEHGLLLPGQFLPDAEHSGFIEAIGRDIIEKAFKQYRHYLDLKLNIPRLSLNICKSQINSGLSRLLVEQCSQYKLQHCSIELEFTEKDFSNITDSQRTVLRSIHANNFFICIDNFGSSTSSLSSLLQCSINAIKIDPELIQQAQHSLEANKLLPAIKSLCISLNIEMIAKNVDSVKTYDYLRSININQIQGYLISRPLSAGDVKKFISPEKIKVQTSSSTLHN